MKTKFKSAVFNYLVVIITVVIFILSYVGLKLQIDYMFKEIMTMEETRKNLENKKLNLTVEVQALSSEERIRTIAINELGLVSVQMPYSEIELNKEELNRINSELNEQH